MTPQPVFGNTTRPTLEKLLPNLKTRSRLAKPRKIRHEFHELALMGNQRLSMGISDCGLMRSSFGADGHATKVAGVVFRLYCMIPVMPAGEFTDSARSWIAQAVEQIARR
jgi:hypothetical protein